MANNKFSDYSATNSIDGSADYLLISPSNNNVYKRINRNTLLNIASQPLGLTDTQSPTNKTFDNTNAITVKDGSLTIQNTGSTTKQAVFSASGITVGQTRTFTFPDASGTLTTNAGTQTLTSKTITSPTITGGTIDNSTITVDSISGHTVATTVTVANLQINNGVLNSANAVTSTSVAAGAIQPQALTSGTGSGWAFSTWSAGLTNWTIGTGGSANTTSKYIQIGKAVFFYINSILGTSGASVGTNPTFNLPVTANSSQINGTPIGTMRMSSAGGGYIGYARLNTTTTSLILVYNAAATYLQDSSITASVPATWAPGDFIEIFGNYEAA